MVMTAPGQRYTESIPVIDIRDFGYRPFQLAPNGRVNRSPFTIHNSQLERGGGSHPGNPYAVIGKTGPTFLQPGATARYEIRLANYESMTHTYRLTDTLPPQLTYIPGSATSTSSAPAGDLNYDPATRTLTWQGELSPGHLDTIIEENSLPLSYLDLADFGAVNLCDAFIDDEGQCDAAAVTFNLGVNGYSFTLYGQPLHQITLSVDGLVLGDAAAAPNLYGRNTWLPDGAAPSFLLAGLWRDADLTTSGRWHAAIVAGLIPGHDVFYAQWHDAPHANDPDLTARHAIALVLNGEGALNGHAFFIYDNISDPARTVAQGFTIGIEDKSGMRGATYAYAPCCGDSQPAQGYPPPAGTTLQLRPALFGSATDYRRTFSYEVIVNGRVPETIANTAVATSSSDDPALAAVWATHYLYVRRQTYLPLLRYDEVTP